MKKQILDSGKRALSAILAVLVFVGSVSITPGLFAKAENYPYDKDTILFEEDYSGASNEADGWAFKEESGDLFPTAAFDDEVEIAGAQDKRVLKYQQFTSGLGVLVFGHDYVHDGSVAEGKYTPVKVQKNVSYEVEFDYYMKGTTGAALEMGLAVGATDIYHYNTTNEGNYTEKLSLREPFFQCGKGTVLTEGWNKDVKRYITVPADADLTKGDNLLLYITGGDSAPEVYFDNVKVTALAGITVNYVVGGKTTSVYYQDGVIPETLPEGISATDSAGNKLGLYTDTTYATEFFAEDYQRTGSYTTITLYGRYKEYPYEKDTVLFEEDYSGASNEVDGWAFKEESGDLFPTVAFDDEVEAEGAQDKRVLKYQQFASALGVLVFGHDYVHDGSVAEGKYTPIQVEKNVTYEVEFDYYLKGTTGAMLEMGLAVGATDIYHYNTTSEGNFAEKVSLKEHFFQFAKGTALAEGWNQNEKVYITIPADADLTKGDNLLLYVTGGDVGPEVYLDNVKVTALAGVTVNYVVDDKTTPVYYPDGMIPETLPDGIPAINSAGNKLALYTDAAYTNAFSAESYARTGIYTTVTLYGKYEKFTYTQDTVLADEDYTTAQVPTSSEFTHPNSGDLMPAKDPTDSSDTVLRYRAFAVGLGVLQLGYDYADLNGKANLTDYVKAYNGITYKITFDYLVSGTPTGNSLDMGVAIGAPTYKFNWPNGVSEENYPGENVAWYEQLMSFEAGKAVNTGWQTKTIFVSVPDNLALSKYDALQLYAKGGSGKASVYFDNVKVVGLADRSYTVKFNTNGGNAMKDMTVDLKGLGELPQATRKDAVFMGWYTDASLKTPFEMEKYLDTTKPITLYAKWHVYTNGAVINFDDLSFWKTESGALEAGRLNYSFVPTTEGSNNVMKYTMAYAANEKAQVEERGNVKLDSDIYPATMALYNPDLTVTGDFNYLDVAYRAKVGKTYKVSFKYKVTSLDKAHSDSGISFSVLTGNIMNTHSQRVVQSNKFVTETTTTGWKTATAYFTVEEFGKNVKDENGITFYSDTILLAINGYGTALIDDISVTDWDVEAPTVITFATKGGEEIPMQEYIIRSNTVLPKAVRKGYEFDAWYLDSTCTKKFNPATYKRANGILTLYAGYKGMEGVTEIDFEDYRYYLSENLQYDGTRVSTTYTSETEGENTFAKFKLRYSNGEQKEVFGDACGNFGTYGSAIGLYDPSVLMAQSWTYDEAGLYVEEGEKVWISFEYKTVSVDTESDYPSMVSFAVGVTKADTVHSGRQFFERDIAPVDTPSDEWKTASTYFTVPKLTEGGNRLSLFIFGYGEICVDNIKVIRLNDAVVFDTDGGTVTEPFRGTVGSTVTLPKDPVRGDSKFMGWYTDKNCTEEYTVGKMESGVNVLYAKFLTYQTIQDFEHYSIGMSERFETDYFVNKLTNDSGDTEYYKWLGSGFMAENVRNGKASIQRFGDNQYRRYMGLFYVNDPLTVGEEYELSIWVKITDYFIDGNIELVYSDQITDYRSEVGWDTATRGERFETIVNTAKIAELGEQWVELRYTFTAKSKYVGISTPGITTMYLDDACITLTSADESYARSIEGDGISYAEWYQPEENSEKDEVVDTNEEKKGLGIWDWTFIITGTILVLGAIGFVVFFIIRKKKRQQ